MEDLASVECPSCGRDIADGSRFCPYCGLHVQAARRDEGPEGRERRTPSDADVDAEDRRSTSPDPSELSECPRCGAPNSARRILCGRCGADLETGAAGVPARTAPPRDETEIAPEEPRSSRRAWLVVVVLGALIGSAVGLVLWLRGDGVGGAADDPPTFDAAAYPDDPEQLQVVQVSASSQLPPEGSISYEPGLVVDDDPTTAWNEGAEGSGAGESLRLQLAQDSWVTGLVLRNGYQKDEQAYFDNARASRMLVRFGDGTAFVVDVLDRSGAQIVRLPEPVHTATVTLEVLEAVPGGQYQDLAISEVEILGWAVRD